MTFKNIGRIYTRSAGMPSGLNNIIMNVFKSERNVNNKLGR